MAMNIGETIYLDHQATTPVDMRVLAEMTPYYSISFGNPHSSDHALGWESAHAVEKASARIGRLIGADSDEIIFTSGATESNNLALLGIGRRAIGGERRRILISAIEHKSVLAVAHVLWKQYGFTIEYIPVNRQGIIEISALEDLLDQDVLAVSVMAVNNEIGSIQNIEKIAECAHRHGALLHCDAAQTPLALQMDLVAKQVDLLSLSGHKMHGPKGIGILFIARGVEGRIEPLIYGGDQQKGLRSGTVPVSLCVGIGAASELLGGEEAETNRRELRRRRDTLIQRIKKAGWPISVNGPESEARHPGNANIRFPGFSAHDILAMLQPKLAASTGSACASGITEPSHVLRAIGLSGKESGESIRFSLGFGTSDGDVKEAAALIDQVLRKMEKSGLAGSSQAAFG